MSEKKKIDALWEKDTPRGTKLLSGRVEIMGVTTWIAVFPNSYKEEGTKQPDFVIYEDRYQANPREDAPWPHGAGDDEVPFRGQP
jgi:hypothetical protein